MKLTGFADEAALDLPTQIKATQELGWTHLSARGIGGTNIHDLTEDAFDTAVGQLQDANIQVAEFGSLIGNWAKPISSDFDITLSEIERAIPRMQRLGTQIVRIMSYAQKPWGDDQQDEERFRRLREITQRFTDAGLTTAHENCMNWGGFSAAHTLRLIEEVPDLKLIFDTGNPVFQKDRSKELSLPAEGSQGTPSVHPWQDAMEFYQAVKEHIVHIHIKDCTNPAAEGEEPAYLFPGKGQAYIKEILTDLKQSNYDGFIAIEPHVATVFHVTDGQEPDWNQCYDSYIQYGHQLETLISKI